MVIDKHHPSLDGHFPGNPIVPGVVILDQIMHLWQVENGQTINKILHTKFIHPLHPEIFCHVQYTQKTQQTIDFVVTLANEPNEDSATIICKGLFSYDK